MRRWLYGERKGDLCPRCGSRRYVYDRRERTVPGGTWYEIRCPNCGHISDMFVPRRGMVR